MSYAVSSLPLSFGVQVHSLAQQCEKPQGQEHKEQQEGRRAGNGLDAGSILLSTAWLWELPPLWDPLPLLFGSYQSLPHFQFARHPIWVIFLQVSFVS